MTGLFFLDCYEKFVKQTQLFKVWANKMVKLNLVDRDVLPEFDNVHTLSVSVASWMMFLFDI